MELKICGIWLCTSGSLLVGYRGLKLLCRIIDCQSWVPYRQNPWSGPPLLPLLDGLGFGWWGWLADFPAKKYSTGPDCIVLSPAKTSECGMMVEKWKLERPRVWWFVPFLDLFSFHFFGMVLNKGFLGYSRDITDIGVKLSPVFVFPNLCLIQDILT